MYHDGALYYTVSKANQNSVFNNQFHSLFSLMSNMCVYIYTSMFTPIAWRMI